MSDVIYDTACRQIDRLEDKVEKLRAALRELISADDRMLAFLLAATSQELGEAEWDRQHRERAQKKREATLAALALLGEA